MHEGLRIIDLSLGLLIVHIECVVDGSERSPHTFFIACGRVLHLKGITLVAVFVIREIHLHGSTRMKIDLSDVAQTDLIHSI